MGFLRGWELEWEWFQLVFVLLCSDLALVLFFLTVLHSSFLECQCMLDIFNLLSDFTEVTIKRLR